MIQEGHGTPCPAAATGGSGSSPRTAPGTWPVGGGPRRGPAESRPPLRRSPLLEPCAWCRLGRATSPGADTVRPPTTARPCAPPASMPPRGHRTPLWPDPLCHTPRPAGRANTAARVPPAWHARPPGPGASGPARPRRAAARPAPSPIGSFPRPQTTETPAGVRGSRRPRSAHG
jgi:hypothetical protein